MKPLMQKIPSKLVLLIFLFWWQASLAEDLVTVYGLALKNDAELMIAESNYLAAIEALPQARSGRKPQISLNANGTARESDNSETGDNDVDTVGYSLNLTQSLYDTEIRGDINVAEANSAAEFARLKSARLALILRVAVTYFSILAAEDNVEFAYAERTAIGRQLEQAQKRFEVGLIAITDVHEAQARFDTAEAQVILGENILENAFQSLVVITADSSIKELAPLGEDLKLSFPNPIEVTSWVALALSNNLELIAAQQNLNAARYERDKNSRSGYPTLDLVASYEDKDVDDNFLGDSQQDDLTIGIELQVPLYTGGRIGSEQAQAESSLRSAQNSLLLQSRLASQQSRTAFLDVVSGISQVKAFRQAFDSSNIALEATQAGFEVGTRTSVDVLISLRETFRTRRDYAGSRYKYLLDKLRLKQAAGILQEDDLFEVNLWLIQQ
jgi:outer membrane protein